MAEKEIVNKVTASGILRLDLMEYQPQEEFVEFDIKNYLFQELVVREKEFRAAMDAIDWQYYTKKAVSVFCSVDAIVPQWVYMLVTVKLYPYAAFVSFGSVENHVLKLWETNIMQADLSDYMGKKVALKASEFIPDAIYVKATGILTDKVTTLMYGEPGLPKVIHKN